MLYDRVSHEKRISTIEDKLFYDEMQRFNKKRLSYDADKVYICAEIKKLLKSELSLSLTTIEGSMDQYDGIVKVRTGWMNDPLLNLRLQSTTSIFSHSINGPDILNQVRY